jgi:hypothetical protein
MADQKLTDRTFLDTPSESDLIHTVDVSDTTDSPQGTSKRTSWYRVLLNFFNFIRLNDTFDSTYTGNYGKVPEVVWDTATSTAGLKFKSYPTYTDLLGGNSIIEGGVIWLGGLNYHVWASKYVINNVVYDDLVVDSVTLSDGDATLPRIDVYAVETDGLDPPTASIVVIEGTPAGSPVKPTVDLETQAEITFRTVLATETADPSAANELVYNENVGETAEWDNILLAASGNLDYATSPYNGSKCLYLPATTSGTTKWQKDAMYTFNSGDSLIFALKKGVSTEEDFSITIQLINSSSSVYANINLTVKNFIKYGFDIGSLAWQLVKIPLSYFANKGLTEYDILSIKTTNTPILYIDYINIQGGVINRTTLPTSNDQVTVYNKKITLTATQVKNLGTTPIDAIVAPGVGKYIRVRDVDAWLNWNSVAFDANHIYIETDGATDPQARIGQTIGGTLLEQTSNSNMVGGSSYTAGALNKYVENTKVVINGVDSVATGDSTVDVYITYEIITL